MTAPITSFQPRRVQKRQQSGSKMNPSYGAVAKDYKQNKRSSAAPTCVMGFARKRLPLICVHLEVGPHFHLKILHFFCHFESTLHKVDSQNILLKDTLGTEGNICVWEQVLRTLCSQSVIPGSVLC